ncbi:MAG: UDP-N-acetylmuramoyl-L-alanine--D-glutamate ligase [Actinomycetota bacterium]
MSGKGANENDWKGVRVVVVGLGASGSAAARALVTRGAAVRVTESASGPIIEERARALEGLGIVVETGGHDLDLLDADLAVVSPGIAPTAEVIAALRSRSIELISEIELAYRLSSCDFLAVTGTNGKTTTTSLLAEMLAEGGIASVAGGNIGLPLIEAVSRIPAGGAVATEVSSFQLAAIRDFKARIAVILNIAEDHTDWHGTSDAYAAAKARIIENQGPDDILVFNTEDRRVSEIATAAPGRVLPFSAARAPTDGIGIDASHVVWRGSKLLEIDEVRLPGRAGLEDTVAAAGAALEYGVEERAVIQAIKSFRPLPHRLEIVSEFGGVTYIDDSKATNPHATLAAVGGLKDVVLIAGGRSKGIDLMPLAGTVPPVRAVIAIGEAADEVAKVFEGLVPVERAADMRAAVRSASGHAVPSGSVLLSPGCASLDMYESYAARGEAFARAVRELPALETGDDRNGDA